MSVVRSLRIRIGNIDVGSLFGLEDGRNYFRFDDAYAALPSPSRPVLSQLYQGGSDAETLRQLLDPTLAVNVGDGRHGLPPFFANLLPEGRLRQHLVALADIERNDDLALLAFCGEDLPGNVTAVNESLDDAAIGRLLSQSRDSYEFSSGQLPLAEAVSLSGVQPKVSLVAAPGGRYVMRSRNGAGLHFIGKLPASDFQGMPEVEFSSLELAKAAGVQVCRYELLPLTAIADTLPFEMREDDRHFLLVHRFDRDVPTSTGRLHMEDMAQVLGTAPQDKYAGNYADMGVVLSALSANGPQDVFELLRRLTVNELLGNYDAHLKNFSLLYDEQGLRCSLAPAYDIVAHSVYFAGRGHGLRLTADAPKQAQISPAIIRALANAWNMSETLLAKAVRATVARALTRWPALIPTLPLREAQKAKLQAHIEANPLVVSWRKRHPPREGEQGDAP